MCLLRKCAAQPVGEMCARERIAALVRGWDVDRHCGRRKQDSFEASMAGTQRDYDSSHGCVCRI